MPETPTHSIPPNGDPSEEMARDRRLVVIVEAFLRQVRNGGSLDPEPFLAASNDLRSELGPLLHGVLRLEQISSTMDSHRRTRGDRLPDSERDESG